MGMLEKVAGFELLDLELTIEKWNEVIVL